MNNFSEEDWNKFTVLRKTREQQQKDTQLRRQAQRDGRFITHKKQTLGANKSSQSKNDLDTRKFKTSSVNFSLTNYVIDGERISDVVSRQSLINKYEHATKVLND